MWINIRGRPAGKNGSTRLAETGGKVPEQSQEQDGAMRNLRRKGGGHDGLVVAIDMVVLLWSVPLGAMGQTPTPEQPLLKTEELDQLLAPVALSGVMTFVIIYQKDQAPHDRHCGRHTAFNPDITRKR
jgi:hypothetical protein